MLGLGGHGLRGVVSALCGVAGGVVVVFGWVVLVAGLRTYAEEGRGKGGCWRRGPNVELHLLGRSLLGHLKGAQAIQDL